MKKELLLQTYDDRLIQAGQAAQQIVQQNVFARYHQTKSPGTKEAQKSDLLVFSRYLKEMGVLRSPEALFLDPFAWEGVTSGILEAFRQWLYYAQSGKKGYSISSVNRFLATLRQYCKLAFLSGVISQQDWLLLKEVKAHSYAEGSNVDRDRFEMGIIPRMGNKKAEPTMIDSVDFSALQEVQTNHVRERDDFLQQRDFLLLCLLGEHGLRVGEVVGLNVEHIDLRRRKITVTHFKTHEKDTLDLLPATEIAVRNYFSLVSRERGQPLFPGYKGKRMTRRGITDRITTIGNAIGITHLSPHDLRHYFTREWFAREELLNVIQRYGGWKSGAMPLYYAKLFGVDNSKPKILQERNEI